MLELGSGVEGGLQHRGNWVRLVHEEVANPGGHDEVARAEAVATDVFAVVMAEVLLDQGVEQLGKSDEGIDVVLLLVLWSEQDGRALAEGIGPGVNDWVVIASALPVLGVVVAVPDAEHAEDSAELGKAHFLALDSALGLGETATEFATTAGGLLGLPALWRLIDLLVGLSVILKHHSEGVGTTVQTEVVELDRVREQILSLL